MGIFFEFWFDSFKNKDYDHIRKLIDNRNKIVVPAFISMFITIISTMLALNINHLWYIAVAITELFFIVTMIRYGVLHWKFGYLEIEEVCKHQYEYQERLREHFDNLLKNKPLKNEKLNECLYVLELPKDTTNFLLIKKKFRKMISKYHPDRPNGNEQKTMQIIEAFKYLEEHYKDK